MAVKAHCMVVARDPSTGAVLTSATVNVYNPGTVTPISATIFDKSNNVLSNPLTSDPTTGLIDFYLNVAQEVDLVIAKSGFTTRTYSNVPVLDDASLALSALLTTTGDIAYASSANTPARLPIGSTGAFLTVSGGIPAWSNTIASGGLTITAGGLTIGTNPSTTGTAINLGSNLSIYARNNANNGDVQVLIKDASDRVSIASNTILATSNALAFFGGTIQNKQTITGSKGANAALTNLLTALANYGLVVDSTT